MLRVVLILIAFCLTPVVHAAEPHPWRPPFGLDRVGTANETFEAAAEATPDEVINPVDLGAILPPADWLLLGPGQTGKLRMRALHRGNKPLQVSVKYFFESKPDAAKIAGLTLDGKTPDDLAVDLPEGVGQKDVLDVTLSEPSGEKLWDTKIRTMRVSEVPKLPTFGAVKLKLRYDAPISVRDPKTGTFSGIDYDTAWDKSLDDVVVALPSGARYVFWRGSSYIPFWATRHNAGLCTEWAEITSQPAGAVDCVEPLMDKTLKYGRVEIVESTAARVHVRWTYQSTDLLYKVWGDLAVEDYYFYPDGYGTRVVSLTRDPANRYELAELIVLGPQQAYPLSFIPEQPIDLLFLDGEHRRVTYPATKESFGKPRSEPAVYRVRPHRLDPESAIFFSPNHRELPQVVWGPFVDKGQVVTPGYWGSHWPLARGNATGSGAINDRIHATPHHTSLASWAESKPTPLFSRTETTADTLGRVKPMVVERWAWMIGMTDAPDPEVLDAARSFATPAKVTAEHGARVTGYAVERRATTIVAEANDVSLKISPAPGTKSFHPVFEFEHGQKAVSEVTLDGKPLGDSDYTWDGKVLWLNHVIGSPAVISAHFADEKSN
jgi:hypothetical protein